jgi:glycosyltransferase involved in cell wall biosynthesis
MVEPKLSIIIPYYNTYELTNKLLKELFIQNNKEIEIILIDDGCNEKRLDNFKYLYCLSNLHIIHKENGGVSSARNKGLEIAQGQYIAFIDSDDMIMPNYIETLLELINTRNEDIIYFNWLDINTNDVIRRPANPAVWKAIYKKEILPMFDETLKAKEDYFLLEEINQKEHTEYYYDKVLYIYNSGREDGLTCKSERGEL